MAVVRFDVSVIILHSLQSKGKVKFHPVTGNEGSTLFLTSALEGGGG
jgi:hypothetical protein